MSRQELAPTVELSYERGGVTAYYYYVAGMCGLRSMCGFNKCDPEHILGGIVESGIAGCMMIMTDAYSGGADVDEFIRYVEAEDISNVQVKRTPVARNEYTDCEIHGLVLTYEIADLANWWARKCGADGWEQPSNWFSKFDAVHMDGEYYLIGGRPKSADDVYHTGVFKEAS